MEKISITFILIALIGGLAAASDGSSDGNSVVLQRFDLSQFFPLLDDSSQDLAAGDDVNIAALGSSSSYLFQSPDDPNEILESRYTSVLYGMGPHDLAVGYVFETDTAEMDLSTAFAGATNIGVYADSTLLRHTPEDVRGTQTRSWASFDLPEGTAMRLDIDSRRQLYADKLADLEAMRSEIREKFKRDRAQFDFKGHIPDHPDWNIDTDSYRQYFGGLNWDIGSGYTDIIAEDGLEYQGSMDVIISSNYDNGMGSDKS